MAGLCLSGDSGEDMNASSRLACDLQRSAQPRRPLAHGFEAEVAGEVELRVEADAVVKDLSRVNPSGRSSSFTFTLDARACFMVLCRAS
jgi:hypothetical protein